MRKRSPIDRCQWSLCARNVDRVGPSDSHGFATMEGARPDQCARGRQLHDQPTSASTIRRRPWQRKLIRADFHCPFKITSQSIHAAFIRRADLLNTRRALSPQLELPHPLAFRRELYHDPLRGVFQIGCIRSQSDIGSRHPERAADIKIPDSIHADAVTVVRERGAIRESPVHHRERLCGEI